MRNEKKIKDELYKWKVRLIVKSQLYRFYLKTKEVRLFFELLQKVIKGGVFSTVLVKLK